MRAAGHQATSLLSATVAHAGAVAVVVATLLSTRVYLTGGAHALLIALVAVAGAAAIASVAEPSLRGERLFFALGPVVAFATVSVVVYAITALRVSAGPEAVMRVMLGPATWVSAAFLGRIAGERNDARTPIMVVGVCVGIAALAGAVEGAWHSGFAVPGGAALARWTSAIGAWQPSPGEPLRAAGLEADPNTYGLLGVVALVFALCMRGHRVSRATIAVGAACIIAFSGSRTAFAAALFGAAGWAVVTARAGRWSVRRPREWVPAVAGAAVCAALIASALGAAGRVPVTAQRIGGGVRAFSGAVVGSGDASAAIDFASGGRIAIWRDALRVYAEHPFGAFRQPEALLGRSVHNEYLERLVFGGPLMAAALVALLVWLFVRVRPVEAPAFGPALALAYAVSAALLGPSLLPPFMVLGFFLVGWATARRVTNRNQTLA